MALSTRKKNIIIADWKTGRFKAYNAIAKHYKIDRATAKKILQKIPFKNAEVVEVGAMYESAKKSTRNLQEISAIENAVKLRVTVDKVSSLLLQKVEEKLEKNTKKEKLNKGNGIQNFEETELESADYNNLANAIDKVSVTTGVNQRFANQNVNINNQLNQQTSVEQTGITIKFVED